MKVEVDVLRAEQVWDFGSGIQQNYLVIEFAGTEIAVPCSEEQLARAVLEVGGAINQEVPEEAEEMALKPVQLHQPIFAVDSVTDIPQPRAVSPRVLAAVSRPAVRSTDDAGITQG